MPSIFVNIPVRHFISFIAFYFSFLSDIDHLHFTYYHLQMDPTILFSKGTLLWKFFGDNMGHCIWNIQTFFLLVNLRSSQKSNFNWWSLFIQKIIKTEAFSEVFLNAYAVFHNLLFITLTWSWPLTWI
jgi:hypothetical protein